MDHKFEGFLLLAFCLALANVVFHQWHHFELLVADLKICWLLIQKVIFGFFRQQATLLGGISLLLQLIPLQFQRILDSSLRLLIQLMN